MALDGCSFHVLSEALSILGIQTGLSLCGVVDDTALGDACVHGIYDEKPVLPDGEGGDCDERKFGVRILELFAPVFRELEHQGMLKANRQEIRLSRRGLLQVDGLLPMFYAPEYRGARYT